MADFTFINGDETIIGTTGDDIIDTRGYSGDKTVLSGNGADTIKTGDGNDIVYAGYRDDDINLGDGDDTAFGGGGNDVIYGNKGHNDLRGNAGDDTIYSGKHTSELYGGKGDDTLNAYLGKGADHTLTGGIGNNAFNLYAASETLQSEIVITDFVIGQDTLLVSDDDQFDEDETVDFANLPEGMWFEQNDQGEAVLHLGQGDTVLFNGVSVNDLLELPPLNGQIDGTNAADIIDADYVDESNEGLTNGDDIIIAGKGDDIIDTRDFLGDKSVYGGNGADTIRTGDGNDTVYAGQRDDEVSLGDGDDTAFGGGGDDTIYGNKGHNVLHGDDGDDTIYSGRHTSELFGDDGDDSLHADLDKGGDHTLTGGEGNDAFNLYAASDTLQSEIEITDFVMGQDTLMIDGTTIDGTDLPEDLALSENDNGDLVITFNDDETVTLTNVSLDEFTSPGIEFLAGTGLPLIAPDPAEFEAAVAADEVDDFDVV